MVMFFHFISACPPGRRRSLLRIEFDDQLFVDGNRDRVTGRDAEYFRAELVGVDVEPLRRALALARLDRRQDDRELAALLADPDGVARLHQERRNVHGPAVDRDVAMADDLPALATREREVDAIQDVVEPALQHLEQHLAGHAMGLGGLREIVSELPLEQTVDLAGLLLLAQLLSVVRFLDPPALAVLPGRVAASLDRTLVGETACALEEQLHARPPAHPAPRFMPWLMASRALASAATWAAKGVLLREPLKPTLPELAQVTTAPSMSVMVMIVLLKLACTWATPFVPTLRSRFFVFLTSATRNLHSGARHPARLDAQRGRDRRDLRLNRYRFGPGFAAVAVIFFIPVVFFGPLRVRALVFVR